MKTVAQLNRQSMIETVADGSELLNVRLRRVGAERVQGIKRDVERGRRTDAVEIEDGDGHTEFENASDGIRIRRIG